ncbi:MAG: hypothetical protein OHK0048_16870 [Rhodoferax sp.]
MNATAPHAAADTAPAHTLRLILGDQLDPQHPWFAQVEPGVVHTLMAVRQETDSARHHAQKVLALFAAMRAFADALRAQGHRVVYWRIGDADNAQTLRANLHTLLLRLKAQRFEYQAPDAWRLDQELQAFSAANADGNCVSCSCIDSSHFLTTRTGAAAFFGNRRQWLMENLYRHLRRRHGVLPDWFWTGHTRMACLAHAIGQTLRTGYAHHIQRLMVIGNFALLAGLDPAEVDAWYLGVYVDAFESGCSSPTRAA